MAISVWWVVAAFFAGSTAGVLTLAFLASPVRDVDPEEHGELEPTR